MMDKEAMEETLEVLGEIADGCKAQARALKGLAPKAPVINNKIEVPQSAPPTVNNQINVPPQAAQPAPIVNILPNMWAGEIKVHRHPNGLVSHYELKPRQP